MGLTFHLHCYHPSSGGKGEGKESKQLFVFEREKKREKSWETQTQNVKLLPRPFLKTSADISNQIEIDNLSNKN